MKNLFFSTMFSMITIIGFSQNSNYQVQNAKGEEYLKKGDTLNAISEFSKVIEINPKNYMALKKRGILYNAKKNFQDAEKDFSACIAIKQTDAEAYYQRGLSKQNIVDNTPETLTFGGDGISDRITPVKSNSKNWDGVIEDYDKAIAINPNYKDAYMNRGTIMFVKNDYSKAIKDLSSAIRIDPKYSDAYLLRASANEKLKQSAEAISDYDLYIELNPNNTFGYEKRATSKIAIEDYVGSIDDFSKIIKLDPQNGSAYYWRGVLKVLALKQKDSGCLDIQKAKELGYTNNEIAIDCD